MAAKAFHAKPVLSFALALLARFLRPRRSQSSWTSLPDDRWAAVADFISRNHADGERTLAPHEFVGVLPGTVPYSAAAEADGGDFDWLVLHKGMLDAVDPVLLYRAAAILVPVFANEVFVVLSGRRDLPKLWPRNRHIPAFRTALRALPQQSQSGPQGGRARVRVFSDPVEIGGISRASLEETCRAASQAVYLGGSVALCRVLTKYLCYCDTTDRSLTPHLCLNGYWETWVTQAIARTLRPGMRCLDLGANCGYFSLLMADAVGSSGRVAAVEANPRLADLLEASLDVNGFLDRATVMPKAIAASSAEKVRLNLPADGHLADASTTMPAGDGAEGIMVETISGDDLVADWDRVDLVKVDVEGAEEPAWRGMTGMLARNPDICVILEFHNHRQYDSGDFVRRITSAGFRLRYIDEDSTIKDLAPERALTEAPQWMLYLTRN